MKTSIFAVAIGLWMETTGPRQQPVFQIRTDAVLIAVRVQHGKTPVGGLSADDFVLLDDGARQRAELLRAADVPLDLTLVLDRSWLSKHTISEGYRADVTAIAASLRPSDRLSVIEFGADVVETLPMSQPGRSYDVSPPRASASAALFDALLLALARPPVVGRIHLIAAFSTGLNAGRVVVGDARVVDDVVARSDAVLSAGLWNQRINGRSIDGLTGAYVRNVLERSAATTGGVVVDAAGARDAVLRIIAAFRSSYLLAYTPTGPVSAGWHAIAVTTPRFPSYQVQARTGYWSR